jgi:hypothetical protein
VEEGYSVSIYNQCIYNPLLPIHKGKEGAVDMSRHSSGGSARRLVDM